MVLHGQLRICFLTSVFLLEVLWRVVVAWWCLWRQLRVLWLAFISPGIVRWLLQSFRQLSILSIANFVVNLSFILSIVSTSIIYFELALDICILPSLFLWFRRQAQSWCLYTLKTTCFFNSSFLHANIFWSYSSVLTLCKLSHTSFSTNWLSKLFKASRGFNFFTAQCWIVTTLLIWSIIVSSVVQVGQRPIVSSRKLRHVHLFDISGVISLLFSALLFLFEV